LPKVVLVGGSPWMALLARIIEDTLGGNAEVDLILYSLGRGIAPLHTLFSDKVNLSNATESARIAKRYSGRSVEWSSRRGVYIIEDDVIARSVKRIEQTLWRPQGVEQKVLSEPPQVRPPLKMPEAKAYIEFSLTSTPSAPLSKALVGALRRGRSLVARKIDLVVESGRVGGIRTPAGFLEADYIVVDEALLMEKLGHQALPKWLPLTWFSCMKLAGPPAGLVVASEKVIVDLSEDAMLACASPPARIADQEDAMINVAKVISRYVEAGRYNVRGVFTTASVAPPDRSPLILTHDEWPEGLYAIVGCMGNCLSLASGLADSIASTIKGGEGAYNEGRLRRGATFKEYLGLPFAS